MWTLCGHSFFYWTPTFEGCTARFVLKNGHRKEMCYDEIQLCVQRVDTILQSIGKHDWEGLYEYSKTRESLC